jgi:hypothetical protein
MAIGVCVVSMVCVVGALLGIPFGVIIGIIHFNIRRRSKRTSGIALLPSIQVYQYSKLYTLYSILYINVCTHTVIVREGGGNVGK